MTRETGGRPPFDAGLLDRLMDEAGLDVLVVTSKHNVQYLLGGYRFFMFDYMDAIGLSRYLPVLIYARAAPDKAAYIANPNERYEEETRGFWVGTVVAKARGSLDAMALCIDHLRATGLAGSRIGIEAGFLPADAYKLLSREVAADRIDDCVEVMEALRAVKTPPSWRFSDRHRSASNGRWWRPSPRSSPAGARPRSSRSCAGGRCRAGSPSSIA